jgi:hypothetical protein
MAGVARTDTAANRVRVDLPAAPVCTGRDHCHAAAVRARRNRHVASVARPMTVLLLELSKRLPDRWVAVLCGPGLIYVVLAWLAVPLGQRQALRLDRVQLLLTPVTTEHSTAALLVSLTLLISAVMVVIIAVSALGTLIQQAWMYDGRRGPAAAITRWRWARWTAAHATLDLTRDQVARELARENLIGSTAAADRSPAAAPDLGALRRRVERLSPLEPTGVTWMADRMRLAQLRIRRRYDLDLPTIWPHVWTMAPELLRSQVEAAQDRYTAAGRLAGWAVLYLALAAFWWPGALLACLLGGLAWRQARTAVEVLATLLEATVDLSGRRLALEVGLACPGPLDLTVGARLREYLDRGR